MFSLTYKGKTATFTPETFDIHKQSYGSPQGIDEDFGILWDESIKTGGVFRYFIFIWETLVKADVETLEQFLIMNPKVKDPMTLVTPEGKYKVVFAPIGQERCQFIDSGLPKDPETSKKIYSEGSLTLMEIEKLREV